MKAATYHRYGGPEVVSITEMPRPELGENEVLIKVHASTVSAGDWRLRSLEAPRGMGLAIRAFAGWSGPRQPVLGGDAAGVIVDKGAKVRAWGIGDEVVAYPGATLGGHAEYLTMPESGTMALKPAGLSFVEAAAVPFGGLTALEFLRDKGKLVAGEKVLVVGASGAVGSAAVQLARHFGAEVTGVCSAANTALVKDLGAVHVIDYQTQDIAALTERFDIILDTTGTAPWKRVQGLLTPRGRLLVVNGGLADMVRTICNKRLIGGVSTGSAAGLKKLMALVEAREFFPLIDRVYPFMHVARAHAHVDTGHKKGAVVLSVLPEK